MTSRYGYLTDFGDLDYSCRLFPLEQNSLLRLVSRSFVDDEQFIRIGMSRTENHYFKYAVICYYRS